MNDLWTALGICPLLVVSAALPLIGDRNRSKAPLLPLRTEILHDWRNQKRGP